MPDGSSSQRPDGSWDPAAGTIYVWYDALINYVTGAGFPDDPDAFAQWWPADLHVIGKDIARFHTIYWPAMLWSAGMEAPRHVWIHGWLLAQGERMSKSLGNFLDPIDVVAGARRRRRPLRDAARGRLRPRHRRVVGLVRPPLQRRPRQRLRQPRQPDRHDGEPLPRRRAAGARGRAGALAAAWTRRWPAYAGELEGCLLRDALAGLWDFVGAANRLVDAEQPWTLAKAVKAGDAGAGERLRGVLGDLVEACRLVALPAAPFMPRAAPRVLAQLGYEYPYGADGNGGPPLARRAALGRPRRGAGPVATAEPLFPRLETEAAHRAGGAVAEPTPSRRCA